MSATIQRQEAKMEITDKELFDAALVDEPVTQEAAPEPATETPDASAPVRDEQGRFAPKEAEPAAPEQAEPATSEQPEAPEQSQKPGFVPSSRLKEEADARRAEKERADRLEQMLSQIVQQQSKPAPAVEPPPKPELWDDPDTWVNSHLGTVKSEVQQTREFYSRKFAEQVHGADKVKEAYAALDKAVVSGELNRDQVLARLSQSMDPYGEILTWYDTTAPQRDPEGYKQKIIADYLASQKQATTPQPTQTQTPASVVRIPTSLNRTTAGAPNAPTGDADMSDAALFANAMRR
jgi:hypothetical protein